MLFQVRYRTPKGGQASLSIEADTEAEAWEKSGEALSHVISIKPDTVDLLKWRFLYPAPPLVDQALFLQNLSALLLSGEDVIRAIKRLLVGNTAFKMDEKRLSQCVTCVDYLRTLRFNLTAIVLAEVGEKSASLGKALRTAADSILEREKLLKQLGKSIWQAGVYVFIGLVLLFGLPVILGGTLETIMKETEGAFQPNAWTHFILNTRHFLLNYGLFVIGVIVITGVFRKQIWETIKNWPFLSLVRDFALLRRGLSFLTAYKPLYRAGIPDPRCFLILKTQSKGVEQTLYEQMHKDLMRGKDLSHAMNTPAWPDGLRFSMSHFGTLQDERKDVLVDTLINTMRNQVDLISQKIAKYITLISWVCIILGIASVALGYYLPLASMRASVV